MPPKDKVRKVIPAAKFGESASSSESEFEKHAPVAILPADFEKHWWERVAIVTRRISDLAPAHPKVVRFKVAPRSGKSAFEQSKRLVNYIRGCCSGQEAYLFCDSYCLQYSMDFSTKELEDPFVFVLAHEYCHRMQYYFDLYHDNGADHDYVETWRFKDMCDRFPEGHIVREYAQTVRDIKPL